MILLIAFSPSTGIVERGATAAGCKHDAIQKAGADVIAVKFGIRTRRIGRVKSAGSYD